MHQCVPYGQNTTSCQHDAVETARTFRTDCIMWYYNMYHYINKYQLDVSLDIQTQTLVSSCGSLKTPGNCWTLLSASSQLCCSFCSWRANAWHTTKSFTCKSTGRKFPCSASVSAQSLFFHSLVAAILWPTSAPTLRQDLKRNRKVQKVSVGPCESTYFQSISVNWTLWLMQRLAQVPMSPERWRKNSKNQRMSLIYLVISFAP